MTAALYKCVFLANVVTAILAQVRADGKPDGGAKDPYGNIPGFGDKPCPLFRCSNDQVAVPKERIQYTSFGCSGMGGGMMVTQGSTGVKDKFSPCCDIWHGCYQTCGSPKSFCDEAFNKCSAKACGTDNKCTRDAELKSMMMKFNGCDKYDKAQRQSCECVETASAEQKRLDALKYFYRKHAPNGQVSPEDLAKKADSTAKMASLMRKLLIKYPKSIKIEVDPQEAMMQDILKQSNYGKQPEAAEVDADGEEDDVDEPDEKIEL